MQRGYKSARIISAVAAAVVAGQLAMADVITYDSDATAGIQTGTGTWDLNTTVAWTTDGGATRGAWTSNSNTAEFQMPGSGTVTVSDAAGTVGAYGLLLDGAGAGGTVYLINDGSAVLQLGAGGITANMGNQVLQTMNSGKTAFLPLNLTASQTWSTTTIRTNSNGAILRLAGNVSGTANLIIDGKGLTDPYGTNNSNSRAAILLGGTNSYSGTTTVTGGAALWLDYGLVAGSGSKLDDSHALILSGGSLVLNNGSNIVETVASTTVEAGGNTIYKGSGTGGGTSNRLALGALTHQVSGVLDVTNAVAGLASTTTQNINGIIGGWATVGAGGSWATGSLDGTTDTIITGTSGTADNTPTNWTGTENVNVTSTGISTGLTSKTVNALRLGAANVTLNFASGATLTVNSGGIIGGAVSAYTGQSITGGKITTAAVTSGVGELFVHTAAAPFTIGSEIADNGATPTALIKGGLNSLTLTGANSYKGRTYVNGGSLILDNGGSLANSNITITAGSLSAGTTGAGGTITFNVSGASSDQISISGGTLDLTNLKADFAFDSATASEYVLVDKPVLSSFVTGSQFASTNLNPALWSIDYDGTASHPDDIVLVAVPEPATVSLLSGVVGLALLRRQRRSVKA